MYFFDAKLDSLRRIPTSSQLLPKVFPVTRGPSIGSATTVRGSAAGDTLPVRFFDEPSSDGPTRGRRQDRRRFGEVIETYNELMGWDAKGVPRPATLYDPHLELTLE